MKVEVRIPSVGEVEVDALVAGLARAPAAVEPFADAAMSFASELSARLLAHPRARAYPELVSLGYFARRSELSRLRDRFAASIERSVVCVPRGLVFHLPPSNVDTIFVYSWLLSLLAGNRNVVRLPSAPSELIELLCAVLDELLASPEHAALRAGTAMVRYGHDVAVTAALSAACDVRTIWGGDETVNAIRAVPLPPHAKELTFADRYSLSAIAVEPYLALDAEARSSLARRLFNDVFWFDQAACSSPRVLVWCGRQGADRERAMADLRERLEVVVAREGYSPGVGGALAKEIFAHRAVLDGKAVAVSRFGGALTWVTASSFAELDREHCGGGLLFECVADELAELAPYVRRKDQTLAQFGFPEEELRRFVRATAGRGIDRVVPIGDALVFDRYWDGHDLVHALLRHVHVDARRRG